tara:strand:- start:3423 stop:4784 length:1362 start_codon:yes stop_codon:yes gene_type:complete
MDFLIGQKLIKQKEFGKALKIFQELKKQNTDKRIDFYLGLINFELNYFEKSIYYYKKYIENEKNSFPGLLNLAIVMQTIGKFKEAKEIYTKLLNLNNFDVRPYYGLFNLNSKNLTTNLFENLNKIKNKKNLNLYEQGIINFLLSKKEKKNKKIVNEISFLKKSHESIFNLNYSYNKSSQFYYQKIISKYFDKIKIKNENIKNISKNKINPIFIIGLPRSGSTLVESILTSTKEKISSYGESHVVNMSLIEQISSKIFNKNFDEKKFKFEVDLENLTKNILNRYLDYNHQEKNIEKFLDKSLENFFNIELIYKIYPNAKFLHTFRRPVDAIISIYQSMLPDLSWTHSLEDILDYVDSYFKVINYYKKKYPNLIMDVNLENFTSDNVNISKNIIKFCNLTWSNDILNFYERDDLYSKTLSFSQIRSKVTKYEKNKYQEYFYLLNNYKKKFSWLNY